MKEILNQIGGWWCLRMHDSVMWPAHGKYRCRTCLREYPVEFERIPSDAPAHSPGPVTGWVATRRA